MPIHVAGYMRVPLAALVAGGAFLLLAAAPAAAEDPTPEPTAIVFARPQYLVHWGWHHTYNGPVKDDSFALYTQPPIETGNFPGPDGASGSEHFTVPDGSGGVYHYFGETLGGPYATDEEVCEIVIGKTLPQTFEIWPPGSGIVDCRIFEFVEPTTDPTAPTTASPTGDGTAGGGGSGDSGSTGGGGPSDEALDVAAGLIGLLLFGGGLAGLLGGRPGGTGTLPKPAGPTTKPPVEPDSEPADPCSAQQTTFEAASEHTYQLQQAVQHARRFEAIVDQQIARLANWTIPMSFGVDLAFLVGSGLGGKLGWGWAPKHLAGKFVDGMGKELLKGLGKIGLGIDEAKLVELAKKGAEGGSKGYLKLVLEDGMMFHGAAGGISRLPGAMPRRSPGGITPDLSMSGRLRSEIASPMADIVGHLMSVYNTTMSVATLIKQLDIVRLKARDLHDATFAIELQLEDALAAQHTAADRLDHCRALYDEDSGR